MYILYKKYAHIYIYKKQCWNDILHDLLEKTNISNYTFNFSVLNIKQYVFIPRNRDVCHADDDVW